MTIKRWTPKEDEWVRSHYGDRTVRLESGLEGRSAKAIIHRAQKLGLHRPVGKLKGSAGKRRRFDEELICRQYRELKSLGPVAELHRAAPVSISRILKRHGITPQMHSRFDEMKDEIIADYQSDLMSMKQLETKYGLSGDQIREKLKSLGLYDADKAYSHTHGRSLLECWTDTHGPEMALQMWGTYVVERKQTAKRGKDNAAYGKPPAQGAGNGWKGWYRGHYFRSLREVVFMIDMDERGVEWISGEKTSIPYELDGGPRTYRPDFIVGKEMIEIKPLRLHSSRVVILKREAAEAYCVSRGLTYRLIDIEIDAERIGRYHATGEVRFDRDYEARFLGYVAAQSAITLAPSESILT